MPDRAAVLLGAIAFFIVAMIFAFWSSRHQWPTDAEYTREAVQGTATAVVVQATQAELDRQTLATTTVLQTQTAAVATQIVTGPVASPGGIVLTKPATSDPGYTVLGRPGTPRSGVFLTSPATPVGRTATPIP